MFGWFIMHADALWKAFDTLCCYSRQTRAHINADFSLKAGTAAPAGKHDKTFKSGPEWPQIGSAGFVGNKFQHLKSTNLRGEEVGEEGASRLLPREHEKFSWWKKLWSAFFCMCESVCVCGEGDSLLPRNMWGKKETLDLYLLTK